MGSSHSVRSSYGRSTATNSCRRSLLRNGSKSREEVKSSTVQQAGYATLVISTRFGTGPCRLPRTLSAVVRAYIRWPRSPFCQPRHPPCPIIDACAAARYLLFRGGPIEPEPPAAARRTAPAPTSASISRWRDQQPAVSQASRDGSVPPVDPAPSPGEVLAAAASPEQV